MVVPAAGAVGIDSGPSQRPACQSSSRRDMPSESKPPTQIRFSIAGRLRWAGVRRRKSTSER
jgi:hypothetical protein